jgi:RNA polymerase sigma factor (sigma-70 family)
VAERVENEKWRGARKHVSLPRSRTGDERLARLVGDGDDGAFVVLYNRYHAQLYRYCRSLLQDDLDAQDALQSTITSALAALREHRRNAPVRPWLYRIAHNEAISMLRRRRSTQTNPADLSERLTVASAEERAGERARLAQLVDDLGELPERQRAALLMRELSDLSHAEIATALDTSIGAAKSAVFDARRTLMEFSQAREMPCAEVQRTISDRDGRALRSRAVRAHLRDCKACAAFAAAIPSRRAELGAIAPPLAPAASVALLARLGAGGAGHGQAAGGGAATAGAAGKAGGALLASKGALGVLVAVTAAAGVAGVSRLMPPSSPRGGSPARAGVLPSAPGHGVAAARVDATGRVHARRSSARARGGAARLAGGSAGSTAASRKRPRHLRQGGQSTPPATTGLPPLAVSPQSPGQSAIPHGQGLHLGHTLGPSHRAANPHGSNKPHTTGPKTKVAPPGKANGLLKPHGHG